MTSNLQRQTLQLAQRHGGSFVSALAAAGLLADPLNRNRLFDAYPELELKYGPSSSFWMDQQEVSHG